MSFENFERGYLLPHGCKDLIDAIKLQAKPQTKVFKAASQSTKQPLAIKGELLVSDHTTASQLAELIGQKPFKIIADAMQLGIFATVNQSLGFDAVSKIARQYGYIAKRTT